MENKSIPTNSVIFVGIIISLISGFLDIIIGITFGRTEYLMFRSVFLPLAFTTGFTFIAFIIGWFIVGSNVSKWLKLKPKPLLVSIGAFTITTIILCSLNYKSMVVPPFTNSLLKLAVVCAVSFVTLIITYLLVKNISSQELSAKLGSAISFLLPVLLLVLFIFIWLSQSGSLSLLKSSLAFIIISVLAGYLYSKFSGSYLRNILVLGFFIVLIGSPIGFFITAESVENKEQKFEESSKNRIKNIILISIDTLRTDALSSYGNDEVSTPNIDKIANDGFLFTQAYSPSPWTLPAFSSIMTGVNPLVHKTADPASKLPDSFTTIAEYLADSGYKTAAIGKNVFLNSEYNLDQGFMQYNFYPKRRELVDSFGGAVIKLTLPKHFKTDASTSELTDMTIKWLYENQDTDFFLWLHYFDPHIPYSPPREYISDISDGKTSVGLDFQSAVQIRGGHYYPSLEDKKRIRQLYDAEVKYVDDNVGRLLDTLKELDLYKDSLIVIVSDHGEEFWEHGGFEHGHTLYNELINVPLIIKVPSNDNNEIIDIPVPTQSILQTILEISDIKNENEPYLASSLVPLLENRPDDYEAKPIISSSLLYFEDRESAVFDENKYIRRIVTDKEEIYNLKNDPGEQSPLSNSLASDKIFQAKDIIQKHKDNSLETSAHYGVEKSERVELNKEKKAKLKALDYIQ